jgi:quercetin dioxygenase-like cupin family protein
MMKTIQLLEELEFGEERPIAKPIHVDENGRLLRFTLRPGQSVKEHSAPSSPVYIVVLKGNGLFSGEDEKEYLFGANSLLIFKPQEKHTIRALDDELVFIALLHGAPRKGID